MSPQNMISADDIIHLIKKKNADKYGLICLNCLINKVRVKEIIEFAKKNNIALPEKINNKQEVLKYISAYLFKKFRTNYIVREYHATELDFIGETITHDNVIKDYLSHFDFIAKQDLIDAFADYCADMGISVYECGEIFNCNEDLYLIKRKPLLKTEAVFVRTGSQLSEENYKQTLEYIKEAGKTALWLVFVTTPIGVHKIGLDRLISDMTELKTWLYVVDPVHKNVWGIIKGKKSKILDPTKREKYIKRLPHEPFRTPSQVMKISNYHFKESEAYKPTKYNMYKIVDAKELMRGDHISESTPKYRGIYRNLIIIEQETGLPLISFPNKKEDLDQSLVSGFLTAMDSFVSEIGGSTAMKAIDYKGFYIHAAYGKYIKIALFLSKPAKQGLIERLTYFSTHFEEHYQDQILDFKARGNAAIFNQEKIFATIKDILDV
jgi:hypothetical protein